MLKICQVSTKRYIHMEKDDDIGCVIMTEK